MGPRRAASLAAALLGAVLASCDAGAETALARVKRTGELRWGGDLQGGAPYVFEDAGAEGGIAGFEVDLARAIAAELGVRATFVQQDWSTLVPALERGAFDIALNGLEETPVRARALRLSRPYFIFAAQLVTRTEEPEHGSAAALKGARVGTLASSFCHDWLRARGTFDVVLYDGQEEPFADLSAGRIDGVLLDDIIVARYGTVRPGLRVVEAVAEGRYVAACRKKDADLCAAIDRSLANLLERGELRRILSRWGVDHPRQAQLATAAAGHAASAPSPARAGVTSLSRADVVLFLQGAAVTLLVSTVAMALAAAAGLGLALLRLLGARPLARLATLYVELVRGTPVLLQLYVLYYGAMPWLRDLVGLDAWRHADALVAAVLGLGFNYAAYEAEVYRAGIEAVPRGQWEAAEMLGMAPGLALRRVVLPQAFRVALPGVTNDFIAMLKDSSLVSVITVVELTKRMAITAVDVQSWLAPGLLCAALYLAMSLPLSHLARRAERHLGAGHRGAPQ